jgi:hypothetical protein
MRLEPLVAAERAIGVPAVRTMAGERNAFRRAAWRGIDDDQTEAVRQGTTAGILRDHSEE